LRISNSKFAILEIPSNFIRIRFSSDGQSILVISNIVFFTLFILNKFKKYKLNLSKSFKNSRTEGGGYAYGLVGTLGKYIIIISMFKGCL